MSAAASRRVTGCPTPLSPAGDRPWTPVGGRTPRATASSRLLTAPALCRSTSFRPFLELFPQVREAVHDFFHSKYASCLALLEKLKPDLLLDVHLHDHVPQLYADVRSKALVQYFSPFVTVDMRLMASAFNVSVDELEKELASLIMASQIPARIDSQNKVLHARKADQRTATFASAIKMGEEYMRDSRALLLRINLMRADFILKSSDYASAAPSKSSRQEPRTRAVEMGEFL